VPTLLYYPLANGQPGRPSNAGYIQYGDFLVTSRTQEVRYSSPDNGPVSLRPWDSGTERTTSIVIFISRLQRHRALNNPAQYFTNTYNINKGCFSARPPGDFRYRLQRTGRPALQTRRLRDIRFSRGRPRRPAPSCKPPTSRASITRKNSTTGKLSLQHQFAKEMMGYVMTSTGYKGLAYDLTSGLNAATAAQQPVKSRNRHAAMKWASRAIFLDNRLTLNLAAFNTKFKDYQQNSGGLSAGQPRTYVTTAE